MMWLQQISANKKSRHRPDRLHTECGHKNWDFISTNQADWAYLGWRENAGLLAQVPLLKLQMLKNYVGRDLQRWQQTGEKMLVVI